MMYTNMISFKHHRSEIDTVFLDRVVIGVTLTLCSKIELS